MSEEITTLKTCLLQMQNANVDLVKQLDDCRRECAELKARLWGQEGWISVKDRLPTNDNSMLCYMNDGFMMVAYHNGYWLNNQGPVGDEDDRITHWMPLPKTPTLDDPKPQGEE